MFDDKFVYVNIVCFHVSWFNLSMKCISLGLILRKDTLRPHLLLLL